MTAADRAPCRGDVYVTDDGTRITVHRTARSGAWADIAVRQPGGASWTKRQPLRDGRLPFEARRIGATS